MPARLFKCRRLTRRAVASLAEMQTSVLSSGDLRMRAGTISSGQRTLTKTGSLGRSMLS